MRQTVCGVHGQLQCRGIGHASAIEVGRLNSLLLGESFNLRGCAVHEHDANIQRTQHGDVQKDVGEILVCDDHSIDCENECLFPELRDVLKNAAQVRQFHVNTWSVCLGPGASFKFEDSSTLHRSGITHCVDEILMRVR